MLRFLNLVIAVTFLSFAPFSTNAMHEATVPLQKGLFHPQTFTLKNGLKVVVISNPGVPVIKMKVLIKAGGLDDPFHKSGLAHFLEHMMFKGTPNVPGNQLTEKITNLGGRLNAGTTYDYTTYYTVFPKAHLSKIIMWEADRFQNPTFPPKEILPERQVVLEERFMRVDNEPSAVLREGMRRAFYWHHPYGHPLIGWQHEMETYTRKDVVGFFDKYYHPGNAVVIFSGDITVDEVKPLMQQYFAPLPAGPTVKRPYLKEPNHRAVTQRVCLESDRVEHPSLQMLFAAPTYLEDPRKALALQIGIEILAGSGPTSRLYKALVEQDKATAINMGAQIFSKGPGLLSLSAGPTPGITIEQLETLIQAEISQILTTGVTEEEVKKTINRQLIQLDYIRDEKTGGADEVELFLAQDLPLSALETWPQQYAAITLADVNTVLRDVLGEKPRVVGVLLKKPATTDVQKETATEL